MCTLLTECPSKLHLLWKVKDLYSIWVGSVCGLRFSIEVYLHTHDIVCVHVQCTYIHKKCRGMYTCMSRWHTLMYCSETSLIRPSEIQTSTIMRTLCLVQNATSIASCTFRTPEMRPPHYSVKRTLHIAPTVSPPIHTHPYSGETLCQFVGSLVKWTRGAKG